APEKPAEPAPTAETAVEPLPADAPTPRSKPKPPKQEAAPKPAEQTAKPAAQTADAKKDFDPNDISALLNKVDPSGGGAKSGEKQASLGSPTGRAEKLTVGELDALRGQIARCWNPPVGAVGAEDLVVEIQMQLAEDGSLTGAPAVVNSSSNPFFRAAADAALRAVRRCAPYTLPAAKYETWKDVKVNFDPRQMMGGW
ncbi:MAG TPA: cell envelope biogenesis protein TolA, partial [Hyphomicrobiales bacterium]|nr:cell envelope biogenesis protein TolA [Hyphomicrobiales bacterium]